jgi:hypothetical protein
MTYAFIAAGGIVLAAAFANPASAQLQGTYTGTSADGQNLTFVVGTDPNNSEPEITSAGVSYVATCKNSTYTLNEGEGWSPFADVVRHKVTATISVPSFYNKLTLTFSRDGQTATGTIETISPYLDPARSPPKGVLFCVSPSQSLTLTYSGSNVRPPATYSRLVYDRKGRVIAEQGR